MNLDDAEPDLTLTWEEVQRQFDRMFDALKAFEEDHGLANIARRRLWSEAQRRLVLASLVLL